MSRTRRTFIFTLVGILVIVIANFVAIQFLTSLTRGRVINIISTVRNSTQESIVLWMENARREASSWAESPVVISGAQQLAGLPQSQLANAPAQSALASTFSPLKMQDETVEYYLLDLDNTILFSSHDQVIGCGLPPQFGPVLMLVQLAESVKVGRPQRQAQVAGSPANCGA